jgi:hypothetical protein
VVKVHDLALTWQLASLVGIVVLEADRILTALRSIRGLTLAADGITWHKREIFLPWSNVAGVVLADDRRGRHRLVVLVVDLDQALQSMSRFGRGGFQSNLKRFNSPIA